MDLAIGEYEAKHPCAPERELQPVYRLALAMEKMVENSRPFDLLPRYRAQYDLSMHRCRRALFADRESMAKCDPLPPAAPIQTDQPETTKFSDN